MSTDTEKMYTVNIASADIATRAIDWAQENIPKKVWKLDVHFPRPGYDFVFKDSESAALFSLKWAGVN